MSPLRFPAAFLRPLGLALAGVLVIGWVRGCDPAPVDDPYAQAIIKAHTRKMAADAQALREADSALAVRSATVTRTVATYHVIRDTLNIHDTTEVKVFVERADSVVRTCTELQNACQVFRVRADSVIAGLHVENDALRAEVNALHPSGLRKAWERVKLPLAFVGGVYVGSRVVR